MTLVSAEGALLERIFDLTYPIWHEGLTRRAYAQWNTAQMRLPWAATRFHRFALLDGRGELLASLKRYRFDARLNGQPVVIAGLGAVFTPPDRRGRGHATALIERVLEQERRDSAAVAALFSEIGTGFYQRLGFRALTLDEVTVRVRLKGGTPAMLVRSGVESDLPALSLLHDTRSAGAHLALQRSPDHIQFALAKKRLFAGLSEAGTRQLEFFVAEEGSTAVAYIVLSQNQYGWTLEEAGDRDPAGARLGAMLQVLVAREPSLGQPLIRAWWPRLFDVPPQLELIDRSNPRDILMLRPLGEGENNAVALPAPADVFYWRSDYF
jgi:GNAT superfamily N-acetyltransferase